jgi:hypothetical protein
MNLYLEKTPVWARLSLVVLASIAIGILMRVAKDWGDSVKESQPQVADVVREHTISVTKPHPAQVTLQGKGLRCFAKGISGEGVTTFTCRIPFPEDQGLELK